MLLKKCSRCKIKQPLENYYKNITTKDGMQQECKKCCKEKFRKYCKENKQKIADCKKIYRETNKEKIREYRIKYYKDNIDSVLKRAKIYRKSNREKIREYDNKYKRERKKTDKLYKLKANIRTLIGDYIKKKGFKKSLKTEQILGCSFEEFKIHIENQFTGGMSWNNRDKWHIDHITPLKTGETEEEIIRLNHYTNLQPLWAEENLKKGAKIL